MQTLINVRDVKVLSKEQQRKVTGGLAEATGYCGVKINGSWRRLNDVDGNGTTIEQAQRYVYNGSATNWCCDSCAWNNVS
jgi:hypothetical protein